MIANQSNISISQTSIIKTTTRFAAKNSIHGCISNLALIGSTLFNPVQNEDSNLSAKMTTMPKSTKMLLDLVSAAWGTSVCPVLLELIVSTDDTTEYIFEGTKDKQPKFILTTKSSIVKQGKNALYRVKTQNQ